jgi:hypothetical protein
VQNFDLEGITLQMQTIFKAHWLPRLLWFWSIVSLCTFGVLLTHQSDVPAVLGRYSTLVAVQLLVLVVLIVASCGVGVFIFNRPELLNRIEKLLENWREKRFFEPLILLITSILLVLMWVFFLGNHLPTYGFLRAYIGLGIVICALALIGSGTKDRKVAHWRYIAIGTILIAGIIALITVSYYPALYKTDEAFVYSMGRNFMETGHTGVPIYRYSLPGEEYGVGKLWIVPFAAWLKIAGLSLASGRLFFLMLGYLCLPLLWVAAYQFYDEPTAYITVIIGAFVILSQNYIRYDVVSTLFLSLSIFLYSLNKNHHRWWLDLLTGISVGLCINGQAITFCFGIAFALFYMWQYLKEFRTNRRWFWAPFWLLGLGGALSLMFYVLVILKNTSTPSGETMAGPLQTYASVFTNFSVSHWFAMTLQYTTMFLVAQPILSILALLGIVLAFIEKKQPDNLLLVLYLVWTITIIFTYYYFPVFYVTPALPFLLLLAARAITRGVPALLQTRLTNELMSVIVGLLAVWLLASTAKNVMPGESLEDVVETGTRIAKIVPKDATIVAAEPFYFGMLDHKGFVAGATELSMVAWRHYTPENVWTTVAPDALVFSSAWSTEPGKTPALLSYMKTHNFMMVQCWQTPSFGQIELWMNKVPAAMVPNQTCEQVCNPRTGCSQ